MSKTIFVTGATGNVGREVVRNLLQRGQRVIAARLPHEQTEDGENLRYEVFDFQKPHTWDPCLKGVTKVFLMRPPHIANIKRDMYPFMRYMKEKEIQQVVFLSVQGVEGKKIVPHYKVEILLKELRIPYTFLRPSFFMQNLSTAHLAEIRNENMLFVPAGGGKTNFIDVRDIGEIAALLFLDAKHLNQAYTITGPKSFSYQEVADCLTRELGADIRFVDPNPFRFITYHLQNGRKLPMTLVMLALYSVVKSGNADITTTTSKVLLGRNARSLEDFVQDHRNVFLGSQ